MGKSLKDRVNEAAEAEAQQSIEESRKVVELRRERNTLQKENDELRKELEESKIYQEFFGGLSNARPQPPSWLRQARAVDKRLSVPTAFLSDVHLDEVVRPEQVNYVNQFNRAIAEKRLRNFFDNTVEIADDYLKGLNYGGIVLPLGGDTFSGDIHEELKETNAARLFESLLHWIDPMIAGITLLADAFGKVYVPAVPGNHGRMSRKPKAKFRAQDNLDWLFAKLLEKFLKHDKRITFAVSEGADLRYDIFGTRYQLTHGDQFKGGGGIAGLLSPLMLGDHRKRKRQQAIRQPYDILIIGHWHQYGHFKGLIVNGSVKGYDEYALISNFDFELPTQAFWITDPKHGITIHAPIHLVDKSEKWYPKDASTEAAIKFKVA